MWLAPRTSLAYIILAKKLWTLTNSSLLSIQRRLFTFSSSFKSSSVLPSFYMNFVQRCAAVVSFVRPGGHITEPAIYNIEIPTKDERSLSHDAVTATIIGNIWTVVGGSIVVAQVERVPYDPDEPPILRPLESVSAATARSSPILLNKAILDPNHFDYETFDKCYSSEENLNSVGVTLQLHVYAHQRHHEYLLRQDGSLLPYSKIHDHIALMSGHHTQPTARGLHDGPGAEDVYPKDMGIDPMETIGTLPSYYEEEPQTEVQKKPGSRARSAGNKVKTEALASSPIKAPPSRRASPKKAAAPTTLKRAASPRKPVSRAASPKKAAATKPVSASASAASLPTPFPTVNRPPVSAPSRTQSSFGVAPTSLPGSSATPVPASSSSQGPPVRHTRSATREGTMAPPVTPPLPGRRMASARPAGAQSTTAGHQAPNETQAAAVPRPLPAYVPPASQPVAGPSSSRMEHVPKIEHDPTGPRNVASSFAQAFHQWPMPVLVPAAWVQRQPYPGPANTQAYEKMGEQS
ncbi:hypothetical protein FOMPIDRAFT_83240 [Fomitopsis schrenkii]|uniref:Uncharacterized protein n=1 Tax=Fomitopsis schrenkii TaxID=2126942 RepID=S8EN27_FOMSC|nr:hypothetical protein FOMPIDRAFT_83240 [Fomitopsis schrenkii]